jgi:hypothetical protein
MDRIQHDAMTIAKNRAPALTCPAVYAIRSCRRSAKQLRELAGQVAATNPGYAASLRLAAKMLSTNAQCLQATARA